MSLAGVEAAFFLPLVLLLHWLVPRRAAWQNSVLLLASYAFYASWSREWLPLLIGTTLVDFVIAQQMVKRSGGARRLWLTAGLLSNLGALAWFKYRGFLGAGLAALLERAGLPVSEPVLMLALPIGISYFTLIKVGYLLDVHHGRVEPERSLLRFATFVAFFPQVVAGPITRAGRMLPQLAAPRLLRAEDLWSGAGSFLLGWCLKAYVADWIAPAIVDPVFASPGEAGAAAHWAALVGYLLQVFGDFAGYSLLAIGTARWFGIELPMNFDRPFLSTSMPEFWRRWHISLNTWLFDYLYSPMVTGEGWLRGRLATSLVLVFALSGLWHGAQWNFVLWGVLHGLALAAHHWWDVWYRGRCRVDRRWVKVRQGAPYLTAAWLLTQSWFLSSLILFRAPDTVSAGRFVRGLLGAGRGVPFALDEVDLLNLMAALTLVVGLHLLGTKRLAGIVPRVAQWSPVVQGAAVGLVLVWLLLFAPLARGTFIYAQF